MMLASGQRTSLLWQSCIAGLLFFSPACSSKFDANRSKNSRASSDDSEIKNSKDSAKPAEDFDGPLGYTNAAIPVPVSGSNLVSVLVSANCVKKLNDGNTPCSEVRLSAKIKIDDADPMRFAFDTAGHLGIRSSSWRFQNLPPGVTCKSTGGDLAFNPLCTGTGATTIIKATLTIIANDGAKFAGDSPNSLPESGAVFGNFLKLDSSKGFASSGETYKGASAAFTEIWAVLKSDQTYLPSMAKISYVTNVLYNGDMGNTLKVTGDEAGILCDGINSGDGTGKWRLATASELCGGANILASRCDGADGGLFNHGIGDVPLAGGDKGASGMSWSKQVWTSSASSSMGSADKLSVDLSNGSLWYNPGFMHHVGVLCFR